MPTGEATAGGSAAGSHGNPVTEDKGNKGWQRTCIRGTQTRPSARTDLSGTR